MSRVCDFKVQRNQRCTCVPEYAVPVWDPVRTDLGDGDAVDQLGQWWCYRHAEVMLGTLQAGPLAARNRDNWDEAVRSVTGLLAARRERDAAAAAGAVQTERLAAEMAQLRYELYEQQEQRQRDEAASLVRENSFES